MKNDFVEVSKELGRYRSENNFVESLKWLCKNSSMMLAKSFDIPVTSLSVLYNYFDSPTKLFSNLYPIKFFNISAKRSFRFIIALYYKNFMEYKNLNYNL